MPADFAGDSFYTARVVVITEAAQTFTDWVGPADRTDYYQFTTTVPTSLSIRFTPRTAGGGRMQLLDRNGTAMSAATDGTMSAANLPAGIYFLYVFPASSYDYYSSGTSTRNTFYEVTLSATALNHAPTVANPAPVQNWTEGQNHTYRLPASLFRDVDGDTLTLTIRSLPSWLHFDTRTRTFVGRVPTGVPDQTVRIVAEDPDGLAVVGRVTFRTPTARAKPAAGHLWFAEGHDPGGTAAWLGGAGGSFLETFLAMS